MNKFLTIYRKDYVKRDIIRLEKCQALSEFKDPINESFRHFLNIDKDDVAPIENSKKYLDRFKEENKKIGKIYFDEPIESQVITHDQLMDGKSVYQIVYCDLVKDAKAKEEYLKKKPHLDNDVYIPLTTQKLHYRNPTDVISDALKPLTVVKPPSNLEPNEEQNEILNVTTGDSEYMGVIGKLGDFIVTEQLHGKIIH